MSNPKKIETVHAETLDGELCLYDWQRTEVHSLNPTAATVWTLCDGQTSLQQMAEQLQANTELDSARAEELVWLTLVRLEEAHLLENGVVEPAGHKILTRRKMLKAVGVAAVMLPAVHSIVAPEPAEAQTPLSFQIINGPASFQVRAGSTIVLYVFGQVTPIPPAGTVIVMNVTSNDPGFTPGSRTLATDGNGSFEGGWIGFPISYTVGAVVFITFSFQDLVFGTGTYTFTITAI